MSATRKNTPDDTRAAEVAALESFFERSAIAQAPAWRPETNDVLTGEIVGFRKGSTVEYGEYPVIVVRTASGPIAFHCFHGVVRDRLKELQPKKGQNITCQYLGKREVTPEEEAAGKKEYHRYYIETGDMDAAPVLDEMTF